MNGSRSRSLRGRLRHVRWLGGGSGAGKSTVARLLAARHGLRVYGCDEAMAGHVRRSTPAQAPLLHAFVAMDMDERWVERPPSVMLETFGWFRGEGFELIVEDLLALPDDRPALVEGFRLLPGLVAPLLDSPRQAVWLAPTAEFRRAAFEERGFTWTIPGKTSDPARALANLLARDRLFTEWMVGEARALGLTVVEVDGRSDIEAVARRVAAGLGLEA